MVLLIVEIGLDPDSESGHFLVLLDFSLTQGIFLKVLISS